jgi:alpha-ketoglutarate-dependent 2,4-dichlorophenoxyacetate dioxygenase
MSIQFTPLHPHFVARASGVTLRSVTDAATLEAVRQGMDTYGVLVFHDQPFSDDEQLAFARRFDGELHAKTGSRVIASNRLGNEALTDISNLGGDGAVLARDDRRRLYSLGNRLWHTDASFEDPPGRYSLLHARTIPEHGADTEFADMRAAYDSLCDEMKARIADLRVHHSIAYSRSTLGFEMSEEEASVLAGAIHPLVRQLPSGRKSLYLASHASRIEGWTLPEGRLLLRELMEHATRRENIYRHAWTVGDLVIWDNRATMHRATPFQDTAVRRELRRITTLDLPLSA